MANQLRRVAILTFALLAAGGLVRMAMSGGRFKSPITMTTETGAAGNRGLETVAANHYRESNYQAAVKYTYLHERATHKVSGYRGLGTVEETESENGGSRVLVSREKEFGRKILYPERGIPGGPDCQHHPPLKEIGVYRKGQ